MFSPVGRDRRTSSETRRDIRSRALLDRSTIRESGKRLTALLLFLTGYLSSRNTIKNMSFNLVRSYTVLFLFDLFKEWLASQQWLLSKMPQRARVSRFTAFLFRKKYVNCNVEMAGMSFGIVKQLRNKRQKNPLIDNVPANRTTNPSTCARAVPSRRAHRLVLVLSLTSVSSLVLLY